MTLLGAIKQLHELRRAEDMPVYYQLIIAEVINVLLMDTQEVRHGHWELSPFDGNWTCSECGNKPHHSNMKNMNYCPNCGAKMDEEDDGRVRYDTGRL